MQNGSCKITPRLDATVDTTAILGVNAFSIFARNLDRIPIEHNKDFYATKFSIEARIFGDDPKAPLAKARKSHPALQALYETLDIKELGLLWQYMLRIAPPRTSYLRPYLAFKTTVCAIINANEPDGYIASYSPLGRTRDIIRAQYRIISASLRDGSYVLYLTRGGESDTKEHLVNGTSIIPEDETFWREYLGTYLSTEEVQQRLGIATPEAVAQLVEDKQLLAVPTKDGPAYPAFQFTEEGELHPTISRVIGIFAPVVATPYTTASWLRGMRFDGQTLQAWLQGGGDPETVIRAAELAVARLEQ